MTNKEKDLKIEIRNIKRELKAEMANARTSEDVIEVNRKVNRCIEKYNVDFSSVYRK